MGERRTERRPTLKMVAELAGVSTATVSYVLSGRTGGAASGVSESTAARVTKAATELNYHPNRSAQAMRTGKNGIIQLALNVLSDPWSLAVSDAVNNAAKSGGLITTILADGDWFRALEQQQCDVAFVDVVSNTAEVRKELATLAGRAQRLVVFNETMEPDGFDVIRSDSIPGCELAMDHLLEQHTRIACLASNTALTRSGRRTRYSVYVDRMREAGLELFPEGAGVHTGTPTSAFVAALELLSSPSRPTAVYATSDFAAIAAVNAAHRLGLRVPHDVAIIGAGNTPDGLLVSPTLSTVGPDDFYARLAAIIVEAAKSPTESDGVVHEFAWTLIGRESTGATMPSCPESLVP